MTDDNTVINLGRINQIFEENFFSDRIQERNRAYRERLREVLNEWEENIIEQVRLIVAERNAQIKAFYDVYYDEIDEKHNASIDEVKRLDSHQDISDNIENLYKYCELSTIEKRIRLNATEMTKAHLEEKLQLQYFSYDDMVSEKSKVPLKSIIKKTPASSCSSTPSRNSLVVPIENDDISPDNKLPSTQIPEYESEESSTENDHKSAKPSAHETRPSGQSPDRSRFSYSSSTNNDSQAELYNEDFENNGDGRLTPPTLDQNKEIESHHNDPISQQSTSLTGHLSSPESSKASSFSNDSRRITSKKTTKEQQGLLQDGDIPRLSLTSSPEKALAQRLPESSTKDNDENDSSKLASSKRSKNSRSLKTDSNNSDRSPAFNVTSVQNVEQVSFVDNKDAKTITHSVSKASRHASTSSQSTQKTLHGYSDFHSIKDDIETIRKSQQTESDTSSHQSQHGSSSFRGKEKVPPTIIKTRILSNYNERTTNSHNRQSNRSSRTSDTMLYSSNSREEEQKDLVNTQVPNDETSTTVQNRNDKSDSSAPSSGRMSASTHSKKTGSGDPVNAQDLNDNNAQTNTNRNSDSSDRTLVNASSQKNVPRTVIDTQDSSNVNVSIEPNNKSSSSAGTSATSEQNTSPPCMAKQDDDDDEHVKTNDGHNSFTSRPILDSSPSSSRFVTGKSQEKIPQDNRQSSLTGVLNPTERKGINTGTDVNTKRSTRNTQSIVKPVSTTKSSTKLYFGNDLVVAPVLITKNREFASDIDKTIEYAVDSVILRRNEVEQLTTRDTNNITSLVETYKDLVDKAGQCQRISIASGVDNETYAPQHSINLAQFDQTNPSIVVFKKCATAHQCMSSSTKRNELLLYNSKLSILILLKHELNEQKCHELFIRWPKRISQNISDMTYSEDNDKFIISTLESCHLYVLDRDSSSISDLGKLSKHLFIYRIHCCGNTIYCILGNNALLEFQMNEDFTQIKFIGRIKLLYSDGDKTGDSKHLLDISCDKNYLVVLYSNEKFEIRLHVIDRNTRMLHRELLLDTMPSMNPSTIRIEATKYAGNFIYLNGKKQTLQSIDLTNDEIRGATSTMHRTSSPTNVSFLYDGRMAILYEHPYHLSVYSVKECPNTK